MIKNNMTRGVSAGALAVLASACGHLPIAEPAFDAMAAKRAGIREVILCKENQKHVEEIEQEYIKGLKFHYVNKMEEVLALAIGLKSKSSQNGEVRKKSVGKQVVA